MTDPRELVMADPLSWALFWRILERLPAHDDPEALQLAAACLALKIAAGRWN